MVRSRLRDVSVTPSPTWHLSRAEARHHRDERSMRRLDLHPAKKLRNAGRHLRSLHRWVDDFVNFRLPPDSQDGTNRFLHWRVPISAKLVSERHTTPEIQAEVIQCLVDAATKLHAALPAEDRHMPVAALIEYPFLFKSEVTLFLDPDYFASFKPRTIEPTSSRSELFQVDVERSRVDIVSKFDIHLPAGARAGGYFMREIDFETPSCNREYERWAIAFWEGD
jgi:hypothetical protein